MVSSIKQILFFDLE